MTSLAVAGIAPASVRRVFRRDATPSLAVILHGRDVRSGEMKRLPRATDTLSWTMRWPAPRGAETKTSAPGGGLLLDLRTGALAYPLTKEDLATVQAGAPIPSTIYLADAEGRVTPYLDVFLSVQDAP